jgi:hypothetical protein
MSEEPNSSPNGGAEPVTPAVPVVKPECTMCGWDRTLAQIEVGAAGLQICARCLDNGRSIEPPGFFEAMSCVHLMAAEIERVVEAQGYSKALWAFRERFTAGAYRAKCLCVTCHAVRDGFYKNGPVDGPLAEATKFVSPDEIGVDNGVLNKQTQAFLLSTFNQDQIFIDRDGRPWTPREFLLGVRIENAAKLRYPGVKPGGLAEKAMAAVEKGRKKNRDGVPRVWAHRPDSGGNTFGPIEKARREIDDHVQRRFWADRAKLGHQLAKLHDLARRQPLLAQWPHLHPDDGSGLVGYYDGEYFVDGQTGECFLLPKEFDK